MSAERQSKARTNKIRKTAINTNRSFSSFVRCSSVIRLRMKEEYSKITRVFVSNKVSSTITIPVELARKYEITAPNYVTVSDTNDGILIKKLEVKK